MLDFAFQIGYKVLDLQSTGESTMEVNHTLESKGSERYEHEFEDVERQLSHEVDFLKSFQTDSSPLKILFNLYKGNYWRILKSAFFYLLKYIPCIVKPILTAALIDLAVDAIEKDTPPDWRLMGTYLVVLLVLIVLNVPFNYIHTKNYSKAIRGVEAGLRNTMVRKLQHLSISFHKEMQSGRIQSKVMRDVEAIEGMSTQLFTGFMGVFCSLFSALIITACKNIVVFLSFLVLAPVSAFIAFIFRKGIQRRNREFRTEMENTSAAVLEMVELIPVTKAHALEEVEEFKVNDQLRKAAKKGYALDMLQSFFGSVNWASFQIFQLICLGFTVILAFNKMISIGDITLYQSYFSTIVSDISAIIGLIPILTKGFESVKSIGDILGAYDIEDNNGKKKIENLDGEYVFDNVYFGYADTLDEEDKPKDKNHANFKIRGENVINGLDLHIKKGETIALVGESGSGKSTILSLVIGFYKPISGSLKIDGNDINDIDLHSYRQHIAMVPQTSILFSGTIRENITFGNPNVSEDELANAIRAANLSDMVKALPNGLETKVGEHGDKLSGGQRQRISIARAILRKPDVIIFDEATSALDTVSEKLIQESIDYLCRDKTTFIVAHRLSTIRNADKIAVIAAGRCVEYGTYEELMEKKGEFYKFKTLQS